MQNTMKTRKWVVSCVVAVYIVYMLVFFKTKYSIHHPLEVLLQRKSLGVFIQHPVSSGVVESKVCPLGKVVAWIFSAWVIIRLFLSPRTSVIWSKRFWVLFLIGSALMNPNVLVYLIPAFALDTCLGYSTC